MGAMARATRPRWYLKEWLKELGIKQARLADEVGMSPGHLSETLKDGPDGRRFNEDQLFGFAAALSRLSGRTVTAGDILDRDPRIAPSPPPPASDPRVHRLIRNIEKLRPDQLDIVEAMVETATKPRKDKP